MREPETPVSIFYPLICRAGNAPTEREWGGMMKLRVNQVNEMNFLIW